MPKAVKVKSVPFDLIMKAQQAVAAGPRGGDSCVITIGALRKEHESDDIFAVITRLQALAGTIKDSCIDEVNAQIGRAGR